MIIKKIEANPNIEIHLPDGSVFSGPRGTTLETFLKEIPEWKKYPIVGAVVNSELRELTYPIEMESRVEPLDITSPDGARIYRRSVTFLLEAAFEEIFPGNKLTVDHSISSGGYYCEVLDRAPLTKDDLLELKQKMQSLVRRDLPLLRHRVPLEEVLDYYRNKKQDDKIRLLRYRRKEYLILYQLESHQDYHHGYMVPSTGYLKWFDVKPYGEGFVLRFPRKDSITELSRLPKTANLVRTFRQYGDWLDRIGIPDVGALNDAILSNDVRNVVLISEALHEQKISDIASQILSFPDCPRIVLIAGPSSSGKTTFSKRLAVQLIAQGREPFALELDNFFVNREDTPLDEKGEYDYESIGAVNTDLLNTCLQYLIDGEEYTLPSYNFETGLSEVGDTIQLNEDQIILLEGIHGMNPNLLSQIPNERTYRIYVSCLTQLNLDRYNRISTTDTRLLRRIIRDARERGYTARETIKRWISVQRGERRYIFPYQENAQEIFNSAMAYELAAIKPLAEPLLRQVPFGSSEHIEAKRLLAFLDWFLPLDLDLIPDNSILREFIGGSILKDFTIWKS